MSFDACSRAQLSGARTRAYSPASVRGAPCLAPRTVPAGAAAEAGLYITPVLCKPRRGEPGGRAPPARPGRRRLTRRGRFPSPGAALRAALSATSEAAAVFATVKRGAGHAPPVARPVIARISVEVVTPPLLIVAGLSRNARAANSRLQGPRRRKGPPGTLLLEEGRS